MPESDFENLWHGIAHQWPSYLAYVTSFLTIGGIWMAHHGMFRRLRFANQRVMVVNLLLLMAVSFLPFPTKLMAETIHTSGPDRPAAIFYGASLLVTALLISALWGSVALDRSLLKAEVSETEFNAILRATAPSIGLYVVMILLAIFLPHVAPFGYLVIAAISVLRARGDTVLTSAADST